MAQKPFGTLDLSDDYIIHDVTLYAHNHPTEPDGINAAVKSIETALKAFDLDDYAVGGGSGDMTKAVYDTDDNGIVDGAEQLNDGTNTVSAADLRDHLDNHPAGGGLVTVSASRAVLAAECAGHILEATSSGVTITLPDVSTLPDNASVTLTCATGTSGFSYACSGSDAVFFPSYSTSASSKSSDGDYSFVVLRKVSGGWLSTAFHGFTFGE